jgi:8-oxo-dGTP pyrophosphatase MutT (NUDIX family)
MEALEMDPERPHPERPRPVAICVIRRRDEILVSEHPDPVKGVVGYRPLGGGIDHGEYAADAVQREIREELGLDIGNVVHLGTIENIFTFMGRIGHDIVFIYEAQLPDSSLYELEFMQAQESDGSMFRAIWKPLADFAESQAPLYPEGLLELLTERWGLVQRRPDAEEHLPGH